MRITITSSRPEEPEAYDSLTALEAALRDEPDGDYAEKVLGRIRAGETHFTVANGLSDTDTYDITEERQTMTRNPDAFAHLGDVLDYEGHAYDLVRDFDCLVIPCEECGGLGSCKPGCGEASAPALTESERFQVQEARDVLATWDLNSPGGVSRETVLADQVRTLLAIIDEKGLAGDA